MDAAGEVSWRKSMAAQGNLEGEQKQSLVELDAKLNMLTNAIISDFVSHQALAHPNLLISLPDKFLGETSNCKHFLLWCSLQFSGQERVSNQQKIVQSALSWATME